MEKIGKYFEEIFQFRQINKGKFKIVFFVENLSIFLKFIIILDKIEEI